MKKSLTAISVALCIAIAGSSTVFADELPDIQAEAAIDEASSTQTSDNVSLEAEESNSNIEMTEISSDVDENINTASNDVPLEEDTIEEYQTGEDKGQPHQVVDEAGNKYLEYDDGSRYTGWYDMEPFGWLYFDQNEDGAAATGIYQIAEDGTSKLYYFDENGINYRTPGTPILDGNKFWIMEDGSIGSGWLYLGNWKMYFDPTTRWARTASDKVVDIDGEKCLFNEDGVMQTFAGTTIVNGAKYWFSDEGVLKCGWLTLGDWKLYFDTETYEGATGIKEIDGKNYLFDKNGVNITGSGTFLSNGNKYYIDSDGSAVTGWVTIGSWKMYFDPETGAAATKITEIDGKKYNFNSDGVCLGEYVESEALRLARKKLDEIGWSLRAAYNWSKSIQYTNIAYPNEIAAGVQHSEYYAKYGFTHNSGNCYVMAATFLYMARVLGYEGNFIEGQVPYRAGGYGPHGWCELNINGTMYVFDPNFEHDTARNGYQITYGASGTWKYVNWKVVA